MARQASPRIQVWLSQRWVMLRGRRVDPADVPWLMGPHGDEDLIAGLSLGAFMASALPVL